jgi:hypothetical protein
MKKNLLLLSFFAATFSFAQNCSELFISEYVEGWSNNKALEIYNPTSSPIDLSAYFVARYSNGSSTSIVANSVQLSGIVSAHDVFVAVLDKRDPNGTELEAPIWDSLEVRGDGFFTPVYNTTLSAGAFYWNGNDAVLLAKGTLPIVSTDVINTANVDGFLIVDIFGKIGENPANLTGSATGNDGAWSSVFPYNNGAGVLITRDHSMIRKSGIQKGVNTPVSFFDPLLEWDSIPPVIVRLDVNGDTIFGTTGNPILDGNWESLGIHECQCNPASIDETQEAELTLFPNPTDGLVNLKNAENIQSIQLISALGQQIFSNSYSNKPFIALDLTGNKGVYILKITMKNNSQVIKRVIIK